MYKIFTQLVNYSPHLSEIMCMRVWCLCVEGVFAAFKALYPRCEKL